MMFHDFIISRNVKQKLLLALDQQDGEEEDDADEKHSFVVLI